MKTETEEETMEAHAEEALHCAFRHIQEALDIKTGDFASMWVDKEKWDSIRDWLVSYQKAEILEEMEMKKQTDMEEAADLIQMTVLRRSDMNNLVNKRWRREHGLR